MKEIFNRLLDRLSEYFARRKGLLLILGAIMVVLNWVIQFMPAAGWLAKTDLLLHIGVLIAIFGVMLAWAL
jgi:low affinity Fe/Cu permease